MPQVVAGVGGVGGVTCSLGANGAFGDRIAGVLRAQSPADKGVIPGLLHDAVLVGPGCEGIQLMQPQQEASFPPWRTPPATWVGAGCPHTTCPTDPVRVGLPRFSKAG